MAAALCLHRLRHLPPAFDHVRRLSVSANSPSLALVRDFIHESLYHPDGGYFSAAAAPVGALAAPIDFGALPGRAAYLRHVAQLYTELQAAWLTPVEIFQPHYGRAVASHLVSEHVRRWGAEQPLRIFEVGGGTGTLARDVLGALRARHPDTYATCTYTCLEISATLARLQAERVAGGGSSSSDPGDGHGGRFSVVRRDATQPGAWGPPSPEPCSVVMMEVLDNLPHDRAWRPAPDAPWQETLVESSPAGEEEGREGQGAVTHREVLRPAADPLVLRCLRALVEEEEEGGGGGGGGLKRRLVAAADRLLGGSAGGEAVFLPTGALALMDGLHAARPNHHLLAGDFDALPGVAVPGRNAPLVATTAGGRTVDHGSYLVPRGAADIFFPSDFSLLARLYRHSWADAAAARDGAAAATGSSSSSSSSSGSEDSGVEARHAKAAQLLAQHAERGATRTRGGYTPLLEDYTNTAFLGGTSWWGGRGE